MITILRTDGTEVTLPECFRGESFDWMNDLLNIPPGYLEFVRILEPGSTLQKPVAANLVVHENGRAEGLPFNEAASKLYWRIPMELENYTEEECRIMFPIVGDVLLLTGKDKVK